MEVAKGYRQRQLPVDVIVVDWFSWTKMGQIDIDPVAWPDPAAMNRQLHDMGIQIHDQRLAPLYARIPLLRFPAEEGLAAAPRRRNAPSTACPTTAPDPTSTTTNPEAAPLVLGHIRDNILHRASTLSGRRNRARSAAQRQLLPHRTRHPLLQTSTAVSYGALYDGSAGTPQHRALILSATPTWARNATAPCSGPPTSTRPGTR